VLPRYTKETFQHLLYSMIYTVDLTPDWKLTPIVFTRNAFALIHTAGKHGREGISKGELHDES